MIYFALNDEGNIFNLGDCGDYEAANSVVEDMDLNVVWIFDQEDAENWRKQLDYFLGDN